LRTIVVYNNLDIKLGFGLLLCAITSKQNFRRRRHKTSLNFRRRRHKTSLNIIMRIINGSSELK